MDKQHLRHLAENGILPHHQIDMLIGIDDAVREVKRMDRDAIDAVRLATTYDVPEMLDSILPRILEWLDKIPAARNQATRKQRRNGPKIASEEPQEPQEGSYSFLPLP